MKKIAQRVCQWFVETPDSTTNGIIGKMLGELADESVCYGVLCADRKQHDLWRIPSYTVVAHIWRSAQNDSRLSGIKIFRRQGTNGKPVRWKFEKTASAHPKARTPAFGGAPFKNITAAVPA